MFRPLRGFCFLSVVLVSAAQGAGIPPGATPGSLTEGVACQSDPTQTYTLYLPGDFDAERRWPALVIFDPRGRSRMAAELFQAAAEEHGWILISSNDTRSDGPMEPNLKAVNALWPEVHLRYPTDPSRIYLAGFSGGAMLAWQVGYQTGEVAGVIAAGGRFDPVNFEQRLDFPSFGAVGDLDFNYPEMHEVHEQLREWEVPERLEVFAGPHAWMPEPVAARAVAWHELQAMRRKLRPVDPDLVSVWLADERSRVQSLEQRGEFLAAQSTLRSLVADYEGLADLTGVRADLQRLGEDSRLAAEEKSHRRWDEFEAGYQARLFAAYGEMSASVPPLSAPAFARRLGVPQLRKQAQRDGYEGTVAQRLLETIFTQTSFYMTRDLFARGDYSRAQPVLSVAVEIHPDRGWVWYQLACAEARRGRTDPALDALERATESGFGQFDWMARDPDLESLRDEPRFRALVDGAVPAD